MEKFVVSARKYRPATFDTVVGQAHITTTLKNAIREQHLAQAFLFCGPRGVGKTTCARILAKTINCENLTTDTEACDICNSCLGFNNNSSFNIHELDAASNNSVDDIRNLTDQVRYPPQYGKYKIYIIDEVHMLSNAAFNAFLKTLEEPPSYAVFILATTEKHKIIPTILSRCQIFDFNRIGIRDIAIHLEKIAQKEEVTFEPEALELIARKADGALRDALSIFDMLVTFAAGGTLTYQAALDNLHILDYDYYFKITEALYAGKQKDVLLCFNEILQKGFDGHNFIVGLSSHYRDLIVSKSADTIGLLEASDRVKEGYLRQAEALPLSYILAVLELLNNCDIHYKNSKNQRLHVELTLLRVASLQLKSKSVSETEEKKKPSEPIPTLEAEKSISEELLSTSKNATSITSVLNEGGDVATTSTSTVYKKTFRLPSVNKLAEEVDTVEYSSENQTEESQEAVGATVSATIEEVKKYWDEFAESVLKQGEMNAHTVLAGRALKKDEDGIIHFEADNEVQIDHLSLFKSDLVNFLRTKTGDNGLNVSASVAEHETKKAIYTNREKLNYLAEKYAAVRDLQIGLDLHTDF